MMIPNKYRWSVLLVLALGVVLVAPSAEAKPATAKKKVKAAAAEASPAPEAAPSLEPKAIEILKAASRSARSGPHAEIQCCTFLRELQPPWSSSRFHHKVRGYSPET